jgi:hypothetical protein
MASTRLRRDGEQRLALAIGGVGWRAVRATVLMRATFPLSRALPTLSNRMAALALDAIAD